MKINGPKAPIRQQHPGQFIRRQDGTEPFTRIKDTKLDSRVDQRLCSVYVSSDKLLTVEQGLGSDFPKLFDYNAGLQLKTGKLKTGGEDRNQTYDEAGKTKPPVKQEKTIDKWA